MQIKVLILLGLTLVVGVAWFLLQGEEPPRPAQDARLPADATPPATPENTQTQIENRPGFLYGRVTTHDGDAFEGRLRWGGEEEAFWGDFFNGSKMENPWVTRMEAEQIPTEESAVEIFGLEFFQRQKQIDLDRPFMNRFGDIARIESEGRVVRVTLKSGATFDLDRRAAGDFDDGVRIWDVERGRVNLGPRKIRKIELSATPPLAGTPSRLHGTVRTRQGTFTGFLQWNRRDCTGSDTLDGRTAEGEQSLRFDALRAIARDEEGARAILLDGSEIVLSGTRETGEGHRGTYVDDPRFGRVLIGWEAFERVDFSPAGSGPAYADFPEGGPLIGSVTTRAGRRFVGRMVFDLDESETTETLDAPSHDVTYTIPFGHIESIEVADENRILLKNGEEVLLESAGDLSADNAGVLIFVGSDTKPVYTPWSEVERLDFSPPTAVSAPTTG